MKAGIIVIVIAAMFAGCNFFSSEKTIGPATFSELLKMDLSNAKKVIVIKESPTRANEPRSFRVGGIMGTQLGLKLIGYSGDFELREINGKVVGGMTDGKRWLED